MTENSYAQNRFAALLVSLFGTLGLVLSALGLYSRARKPHSRRRASDGSIEEARRAGSQAARAVIVVRTAALTA